MRSAIYSYKRFFVLMRSLPKEEVILQGAFLVGMTSLVLLIGQYSRSEVKDSRLPTTKQLKEQTTVPAKTW